MNTFAVLMAFAVLLWSVNHAAQAGGDETVRLGRYVSVPVHGRAAPVDPLSMIVSPGFPEEIATIGDALPILLAGTGYRLVVGRRSSARARLFSLPLPDVHRQLRGISVREALQRLAGAGYRVSVDERRREIDFSYAGGMFNGGGG